MRVHWALHELSLPYETRAIGSRTGETTTPEFTALNPRQKIPVLQDGGFDISESAAIIVYLAERYGDRDVCLIPERRCERSRWLEWSFFIAMELDAGSLYIIRRHGGLKDVYGLAPAAIDAARTY